MNEIFEMLLAVYERAALMLICLFLLTCTRRFRQLLQTEEHSRQEQVVVTAIFCLFAIFSNYSGIHVEGSLNNVRVIAVMSGGILFGPWVGIITGAVAGLHRFAIDIHGPTSVPCLISSVVAGVVSGLIHLRVTKECRWSLGILGGMLCESLIMLLVVVWAEPTSLGLDIVAKIAVPMILGAVSIGLIVLLVQGVEDEKEVIAARQAKLALDIANKTLPYFRRINRESLTHICDIIRTDIKADAVAITNQQNILAYVGIGAEHYNIGHEIISEMTRESIERGKITIKNNDEADCTPQIHSLIIIPLSDGGGHVTNHLWLC